MIRGFQVSRLALTDCPLVHLGGPRARRAWVGWPLNLVGAGGGGADLVPAGLGSRTWLHWCK